ncbi:hypothetical protein OLEAN_C31210 [Oleispira antarctica RB-8]|uniref:1-phosphatidylinositol phosphodiesterase n=1 Tax=Oleispira antarctica RB-8 TaxID=698738 RepID=R4YQC8_OLEAN|nr:hypothetical protein OLEAN_C31210 [Oleispira antarctica RB-8]
MKFKTLFTLAGLALSTAASAGIGNEASSWESKTLRLQNQIDLHTPMSKNNILGSHNTYNSSEYANDGYVRYIDPQQKHTIKEQLQLGARFIELDLHWKFNWSDWRYHLLLCHGGACSGNDKFFHEGLEEMKQWLESPEAKNQVVILYIEDHATDKHSNMHSELMSKIGSYVYKSNGCKSIPSDLTKADVLNSGSQVVVWKDAGCSGNSNMNSTVFTDLGNIDRVWEDRTVIGAIFDNAGDGLIDATDVREMFKLGRNIVNLDDFTYDNRQTAAIWSWNTNEPNNVNNEDCAIMLDSGRWADVGCGDNRIHPYACNEEGTENWDITVTDTGTYAEGEAACQNLGTNWHFKTPTNSKYNNAVRNAANDAGYDRVWLAISDANNEGDWTDSANTFPASATLLKDQRAGLCMNVWGGDAFNGANVRLHGCSGTANEKFTYDAASGMFRSQLNTNYCLDVSASNFSNGGNIQLWSCSVSNNNQKFDVIGDSIRPRVNHNLAIDAFGKNSGDNVGLWSVHGGSNQNWTGAAQ